MSQGTQFEDLTDDELGDPLGDPPGVEDVGDVSFGGAVAAPACRAALTEATQLWPQRNRAGDGILGDARHQARKSDHNDGNAFDLTQDPEHGCDAHALVAQLVERRDPRVKYAISNRRIWNPAKSQEWREYKGENPHVKHAHVSINPQARDDTSPWWAGATAASGGGSSGPGATDDWRTHPVVRLNEKGPMVVHMQELLLRAGRVLGQADGVFGPKTDQALRAHQESRGLEVDGLCGPRTWESLH